MKLISILITLYTFLLSDNVFSQAEINAKLKMEAPQAEVFQYEPVIVTVSFLVHFQNQVPYQFDKNLTTQIEEMRRQITEQTTWVLDNNITDIKRRVVVENNAQYMQYKLLELAISPEDTGHLILPKLQLLVDIVDTNEQPVEKARFESNEQQLIVKSLTDSLQYANDLYKIVGDINITTKPQVVSFTKTGIASRIHLKLAGKAFTFPIEPKFRKSDSLQFKLVDVVYKDTIINNEVLGSKEFILEVIPKMKGEYRLADYLSWHHFSLKEKKVNVLAPALRVIALKGDGKSVNIENAEESNTIIALDVSESMYIEDYYPNRLQVVLHAICTDPSLSKIPVVAFAGVAKEVEDFCSIENLDIDLKPGSAIGNVIWYCKEKFKVAGRNENLKIILLSDGDNKGGQISANMAASLAKKHGIKIYSIGIGSKGDIPFSQSGSGEVNYDSDFFNENILKNVSLSTGGEYYKLESIPQLQTLLKVISTE